jgi:hypothetical protein
LTVLAALATLALGSAITGATPASASSGIHVFVGYADSLRPDVTSFPTPWAGSFATIFEGCLPADCKYDAGAVRIVNNTGSSVTVNAVAVHVDTCTYSGWDPATLSPGAELIVTHSASGTAVGCPDEGHMDTSDVGKGGQGSSCDDDKIAPIVDVTIDGQTTSYLDSGQVLNTGGSDRAPCFNPGVVTNESTQWTAIGHAPCHGSLFNLDPATQTHSVGTTASVIAMFTSSCPDGDNPPLSNVIVNFRVQSGPNAGVTGTGVTDANGQATFSYTSAAAGTDSVSASITNPAGTITSNSVTAIWIAFAPGGGGAFVISDLKNQPDKAAYWWGAQWWKNDPLSTGSAPASFKGYENSNPMPKCGDSWTTRPGNSSKPPKAVPADADMAVIVSSAITQRGYTISGNVVAIVIVHTNAGYAPNPGHIGTGTIIRTLCTSAHQAGSPGWLASATGSALADVKQSLQAPGSPAALPRRTAPTHPAPRTH